MTENKENSIGRIKMKEIWKGIIFKKPLNELPKRPKLSEEEERKRSKRFAVLSEKGLKKSGNIILPDGSNDIILSINTNGTLVLKKGGDFDPLEF